MNTDTNQIDVHATEPSGQIAIKTPSAPSAGGYYWGTGRRKKSIARVRIKKGSGTIQINERPLDHFFHQERDLQAIRSVLTATRAEGGIDVQAYVEGGGFTGQAGAVVLGLARALKKMDSSLDSALRDGGFLTRDPRMKERKKYGKRGARRSFQFSKR